jgi:non-ribosomal peptide synthetase-like protein
MLLTCKSADNTVRWKQGERLNHLFEQRCDQVPPDHLAVITEDGSLTFRELEQRANQAARYLLAQGLKAGDRVGVLFDKSAHAYVGLLAVLKIGAAYVPFDASFPNERIAFILEDAGVRAIVSVSRFRAKVADLAVKQMFLDSAERQINDQSPARVAEQEARAAGDQLFYVIYTSGTTGKPKGVAIEHSGICNFVKVAGEVYGIRQGDRCYQGITLAFDFHVEDLWVPLIAGATLVAGKSGANLFGKDLHDFLLEQRVTVLPCVPTLWATLEPDLPDVRIVLLSGEAVPHHLVARWHRPDRTILNAYGPTECSVSSTLRRLVPDRPVTIGTPLPTYTVVILDEHKDEVVPEGAIGEIGIAGIGLAVGYLNREALTRQKFIPDFLDLPNNPSKRIYRTGDLGRIRDDGELEFHGRIDTQVKLRGYRIELGEIEAVLSQLPQIAQAVVNPYEPEPGAVELVAYYTRKQGAAEVAPGEIAETLRRQLPAYMVPAYVEELAAIPMTANNKADRKNLPPPSGPRFAAPSSTYVAPRTDTEREVAAALAEVMKVQRASVEDNFFHDLGGHSLLMARLGAEVRKRLKTSGVSMQDIYLNPTIEKLARHIDSLPAETSGQMPRASNRESSYVPSDFAYYGCGALQGAFSIIWSALGLWIFAAGTRWSYAAMPALGATYLRLVALAAGLAVLYTAIPVALKWLLIGRWKPEVISVWSLRYFRFWLVKSLVRAAPMALFGGPFYNLYLRLLGAKIGANAVIHAKSVPACTDLLCVGPNTILRKDSVVNCYRAQSNCIHTGPVRIGANAFVGEGAILDINTSMEDGSQLGHASSLHDGQRVPRGRHYHGCPARETTADYCAVEPRVCTPLRRWTYAVVMLLAGFAVAPVLPLIAYALFPAFYDFIGGGSFADGAAAPALVVLTGKMLLLSLAVFFSGVVLGLLYVGIVPRLLNLLLHRDRTYVLYGWHYFVHHWVVRASNARFYNLLFGDSSYIVYYMRWVGWKLNKIIQTGSNFGSDQRHDNPFLCDVGSGTMVSGGLKVINATTSSTSFKLGLAAVGEHNYLGNYVRFPAGAKVGANCLLGTKVLVPIDGPVRENVGLLGSPCFEIPRAVDRDRQMSQMDDETRRRRLRAKTRYNLVTSALFLLKNWFLFFGVTLCGAGALLYFPRFGVGALFTATASAAVFATLWTYFAERAALGFGRLTPQIALVLAENSYYWYHERHWALCGLWVLEPVLAGTPFKNLLSRAQGVRLGKKVFDDGCHFNEYTLIEIGDGTTLSSEGIIQPHSLEEAVFKSDYVKIGAGCTLGCAANVHYGVTMGDHVVVGPDSFVMKGEILDSNTTWRGNPAKAVVGEAEPGAGRQAPEALAAAGVQ